MKKLAIFVVLTMTALAGAAPITMQFQENTSGSCPIGLTVTIDEISKVNDGISDTYLEITADINEDHYGDILALYVDFDLPQLPSGLTENRFSVLMYENNEGIWITDDSPFIAFGNNDVSLKGAAGIKGISALFDIGAEINASGLKQDIDPATLSIRTTGLNLSLNDIERVGIRASSAGFDANSREGSIKMVYANPRTPVPEPAVLTLLGTGLLALALLKRKKNS